MCRLLLGRQQILPSNFWILLGWNHFFDPFHWWNPYLRLKFFLCYQRCRCLSFIAFVNRALLKVRISFFDVLFFIEEMSDYLGGVEPAFFFH